MANQTIDTLSIKISATSSSAVKNLQKTAKAVRVVGNESNNAVPKMKKLDKGAFSLARSFGKFYASCFLLIRGIKALGRAIEKSMDYIETYNYFSVTLDKVAKESMSSFETWGYDSADAYAESFSSRLNELTEKMSGFAVGEDGMLSQSSLYSGLGLDPNKIMNFQAQIMQLTNSVGELGETSLNTTKALTMLASDLSSFTNRDIDQVMNNLQSGIIGQSRALYKYGIDITQASLEQEALAQGISKSVSEMSQSEKMQLRLLVILKNSRVAWGDQANTINSVANQYRILKEQISNLARIIGNVFLPIVQKVLPVVNALVISLQRLFSFLGSKIYGDSWSDIMDGISSGVGDLDDGTEDFADNLADAEGSAKKLKQHLMGIDELNLISESSGGSGSSIGGGIDLSTQIADALSEYERVWNEALAQSKNKAVEIANQIHSVFTDTNGILGKTLSTISSLASAFGTTLRNSIHQAGIEMKDFNETKLSIISDNMSKVKQNVLDYIDSWSSFSDVFKGDNFGKFVTNLMRIADILSLDFLQSITTFLANASEKHLPSISRCIELCAEGLDIVFGWWEKILDKVAKGLEYISSNENGLLYKLMFGGDDQGDQQSILSAYQYFSENLGQNIIHGIFKGMLGDEASEETIGTVESFAKALFKAFIHIFVIHSPSKAMMPYGEYISLGVLEGMKSKFSDIPNVVQEFFNKLKESFRNLWNNFANWLNDKLSWTIDPVVVAGKTLFEGANISLGRIPTFATGGFPEDGLFMANHGEMVGQFSNGRNAVANNQQIVDGISVGVERAVASALVPYLRDISANTGKTANKDFSVSIGDRDIARANLRGQRSMGMVLRTT